MNKKTIILITAVLLLLLAGCQKADTNTPEITPTSVSDYPFEMDVFETDSGEMYMVYPHGWATNQIPMENGFAFGIVPKKEQFDADPYSLFTEPIVVVYGTVQYIAEELADPENLDGLHAAQFYTDNPNFTYTMVTNPVYDKSKPGVTYIYTQAESTLPNGVHTNWMLGTAMADQTVVSFAVGLPDSAMDEYGQMAMDMFNSVEIDTDVTSQLLNP